MANRHEWRDIVGTYRAGGAVLQLMARGRGAIRIRRCDSPEKVAVVAEGPRPGSRGLAVESRWEKDCLVIDISPRESGRWLWVVPR